MQDEYQIIQMFMSSSCIYYDMRMLIPSSINVCIAP